MSSGVAVNASGLSKYFGRYGRDGITAKSSY